MKSFLPLRDMYLQEMVRRDGRGLAPHRQCSYCPDRSNPGRAIIRCMSCAPGPLRCEACAVAAHSSNPFHRVKVCCS